MLLGGKIKELRMLCGLTQEELADRSELTKGYISQLENDLTSPSIATLIDILHALGTNISEFFQKDDEEQKIVFTENDFIEKVTVECTQNWLVPNAQKNLLEPLLLELAPKKKLALDMPHEGEEFGYILQGEIVLIVGNKKHVCKKGQSFYFEANKVHSIENVKERTAKFLWVSSPPTF